MTIVKDSADCEETVTYAMVVLSHAMQYKTADANYANDLQQNLVNDVFN